MNSHLGRFLTHADELLQECRSFGESLRSSLEGELEKMHDTVAHGLDAAAQRTAEHAAAKLGTTLDAALGDRLAVLRRELDELGKLTQQAQQAQRAQQATAGRADGTAPLPGLPVMGTAVTPPAGIRAPWPRGLTALLASANLMLAVLLVLIILDVRGDTAAPGAGAGQTSAAGAAASPDAGPKSPSAPGTIAPGGQAATGGATLPGTIDTAGDAAAAGAAASWPALCQPLAETADAARAHAFVAAAAAAACGDRAGAVTANVLTGVRAVPQTPGTATPGKPAPGSTSPQKSNDTAGGKPDDTSGGAASGAAPKRSRRSKPSE